MEPHKARARLATPRIKRKKMKNRIVTIVLYNTGDRI